jgi:hypothetical protein
MYECDYTWGFGLIIGFIGLWYSAKTLYSQLLHTCTHARTHTLLSTVMSSLPLLGSGSNGRCSPPYGVPNWPRLQLPASNSNSSQGLNHSSTLTHSLTNLLTPLTLANCPAYNILARIAQKNTVPLLLFNCCLVDSTENTIPLLFAGRCLAKAAI